MWHENPITRRSFASLVAALTKLLETVSCQQNVRSQVTLLEGRRNGHCLLMEVVPIVLLAPHLRGRRAHLSFVHPEITPGRDATFGNLRLVVTQPHVGLTNLSQQHYTPKNFSKATKHHLEAQQSVISITKSIS